VRKTHGEEDGTDELPADPPVESWAVPQHGVDVVPKILQAVEPRHCNGCNANASNQ